MNALILVDIQNDFLPGGALAVPAGDAVIPIANRLVADFDLVVATQDWHPVGHASFASQHPNQRPGDVINLDGFAQVLWPDHCVQTTRGADFAAALDMRRVEAIFRKGTDTRFDSYSGFHDNGHKKSTGLGAYLRGRSVDAVTVLGLATDYCVKFTALDAVTLGFRVSFARAASRGVDLQAGDIERAVAEMRALGVHIIDGAEL